MEEPRWIESLKKAPLPPAGQLTERAMALASSRPTRRAVVLAVVPLIAAVPAVALLLPRPQKPGISKIAVMAYTPPTPAASLAPKATPLPPMPTLAQSFPQTKPEPMVRPASPAITMPAIKTPTEPKQIAQVLARHPTQNALSDMKEISELSDLPAVQQKEVEDIVALQRHEPFARLRKLSALSAKAEGVAEETDTLEREPLERKLRFPLEPLPDTPQTKVDKAALFIHADSHEVYGDVTLSRSGQPDELLLAVFDMHGKLTGTSRVTIPANVPTRENIGPQTVSFKSFVAPSSTARYQLGRRPRFVRDKEREQIIGGYVGHAGKVEVPAPEGVSVNGAEFYQSNVYKDHFVRFTVVISQELLNRLGEYGAFTIHGAVFDDKGTLLSVASAPLKYKAGQQHPDLNFDLLPDDRQYHYSFVITQSWQTTPEP